MADHLDSCGATSDVAGRSSILATVRRASATDDVLHGWPIMSLASTITDFAISGGSPLGSPLSSPFWYSTENVLFLSLSAPRSVLTSFDPELVLMLRRLHHDQPASFAFTPANQAWAEGQITKYPAGRQASAIIPLLWRAQEQEGWLSRPAIEHVADMLGMAYIRALEVATFYFMFQLQPVGSVAHVQICGTMSCMICGAEDLVAVCKELIATRRITLSADGKFSWEEVECLGACANAPMAQIGKDYYEDLTPEKLRDLIGRFATGEVPVPGPQNGRYAAEPLKGLTQLTEYRKRADAVQRQRAAAVDIGDTVKRIDGTEVPLRDAVAGQGRRPRRRRPRRAVAEGAPKR